MVMEKNGDTGFQNKKFLNVAQVAASLHLSPKTIYAMCKRRYLPHVRIGSRVLFDPEELQARIQELKQTPVRKSVD